MRKVLAIVLGFALALSAVGLAGFDAEASKRTSAGKAKLCTGTTIDNKKVSFRCKASETCCFDAMMGKGNCTPKGQVCL